MLNIIIKDTLIPDILGSSSTGELLYIPGSSLLGALRTAFISTGIAEAGIDFHINWLIFESEPNRQEIVQRCGRYGQTDSLRGNSEFDSNLFFYSPVQCLLPTLEQISKEFGIFSIQEIDKRKDHKGVVFQNCDSSYSKLLNPRQGLETSPVLYRILLSLYFFTDLIPTWGLKQLFATNNQKLRIWQGIFEFFANSELRLNKALTFDCQKSIKLSRFRWQFEKINLRRDAINYLTLLKDEGYQLLDNQSHLFCWAGINIRRLAGYLALMRELLFRSFVIDNRCDLISLVDMPP